MKIRVNCPICEKEGRFEKASKNIYRMNHDFMKNGETTTDRCYLGNPLDVVDKLRIVSKARPDLVDAELADQVLTELKNTDRSKSNRLLFEILELNRKLGFGWNNVTHYLLKQDNCPHCKEKIAVRFRRIGINPDKAKGNYGVDSSRIKIEQGQSDKTSRFGKSQWELGVEKGNPDEKDIFYND